MPPSLAAFFFGEEENQVSSVVAVRRIRATSYSLLATGRLRHMALSNESFARVTQLTYFQSGSSIASVNDSIASVNDALALVSHLSGYQDPARGHQRYSPPNLFRINHHPPHHPHGVANNSPLCPDLWANRISLQRWPSSQESISEP